MTKQRIQIGAINSGDGDTLRAAMIKINNNFDELYDLQGQDSSGQGIDINGNTITSNFEDTDITLSPNGAGDIVMDGDLVVTVIKSDDSTEVKISDSLNVTGTVTATAFVGDGSGLTGISGGDSTEVYTNILRSNDSTAIQVADNLVPTQNETFSLGTADKKWSALHVAGDTIFLGNIQIKDTGSNEVQFLTADGVTEANVKSPSSILNVVGDDSTDMEIALGTDRLFFQGDTNISTSTDSGAQLTISIADAPTFSGTVTAGALTIGSAAISEAELEMIDGITAGTAAASKALVLSSDKDIGTIRNITSNGTVQFGSLSDGTITATAFVDEDDMSSDSATLIPTQQSVKAYVDAQVTASDLDFQGDSGGALSIDLDSETLDIAGGTGIDTSGSGNTLTVAIDSTVATLAGTQTFTNKTFDANGTGNSISNIETADFASSAFNDEDDMSSNSATAVASQQSIKAYVDAEDANIASDTLTFTNKTIDANGTGNAISNIDIGNMTAAVVVLESEGISSNDNDTTLPTSASVKDYVDTQDAAIASDTLTFTNKTFDANGTGNSITNIDSGNLLSGFLKDEDNMASNSATSVASQQSIKAYVDSEIGAISSTAISEGNSNVTVADSGSGAITVVADGNTELTINDTSATFAGNVIVSGNLTVNGTTTTVATTNTTVSDSLIEYGNGTTGSPSNDAGIVIERGDSANAFIGFDESEDKFRVGTGTFTGASTGNLTITTGTLLANIEGNVTGDVTGNADTATTLETARTIGGVSFNGSANIDLPGVNTSGNQNTSGTAAIATAVTAADESSDTSCNVLFVTAATGDLPPKTGTNLTFNSSSGVLTATGFAGALTGDVTGNADTATALATARAIQVSGAVTGTANFDGSAAINIVTTNTADPTITLGGDLSGAVTLTNLASGTLTATVGTLNQDTTGSAATLTTARTIGGVSFDGTGNINLPGVNTAGNQNTSGTAAIATLVTVTDNENTNEENVVTFVAGADADGGNVGLESDGNFTYNPSTGAVTATKFKGDGSELTGISGGGGSSTLNVVGDDSTDMEILVGTDRLFFQGGTNVSTSTDSGAQLTISVADAPTFTGAVTAAGFTIGSAAINESELETIDGVTAGTVAASKAVVVDSNKDIGSFRNITATGATTSGTFVIGSADINEADLEQIDGLTAGTVTASKAVVVDSNKDIGSFRNITATGATTSGTFVIGSADINEADLEQIDGLTAGTVTASKAVVVDSNKDITGFRNVTASGNGEFGGNLQVGGNLTVSGTTTSVNTTNLEIQDALLELNKNNSGGADVDAGILIQRGSAGNNAVLYWNEGDDTFKAVLSNSAATATSVTDSSFAGLEVGSLTVNAGVAITASSGDVTVANATSNKDLIFTVNDGGSPTEVFRLDGDVSALLVASGKELQFADSGEKISGDGTDLTIASGAKINLNATSDIHIPNDVGIVFGGASEKIEGDGTDLVISANNLTVDAAADIILDAGGNDFQFKSGGTHLLSIVNSSSDVIIKPIVDAKDIIFQQRDGTEVARIEDNATFNVVTGKLAINGTAITSTAAELNALDGITAVVGELNALDIGSTAVGTAVASKAVILDSNKDYTGIRNLTTTGSFIIGNADMNETDLEKLDGITNGTVAANKAVVVDGDKDAGSFRNITATGTVTTAILDVNSIKSTDSSNIRIDEGLDVVGGLFLSEINSIDSSAIEVNEVTNFNANVVVKADVTTTGSFIIGSASMNETDLEKLDGITNGAGAANKALVLDGSANIASGLAAVTASGVVTAAGFTIGSAVIDETDLEKIDGITNGAGAANKALVLDGDADVASGLRNLTASGTVTAAGFTIGSAAIVEAELEMIDGITAGTAAASKALVLDSDKDIGTIRNITSNGTIQFGSLSDGTITVTAFVDEDDMSSNSATLVPTQQSVKAYVDTELSSFSTILNVVGDDSTDMEIALGTDRLYFQGGTNIGTSTDSGAQLTISVADAPTFSGTVTAGGFTIGSAAINEAELETIDGITAGTVAASKAVIVDSSKDITGFRNVTGTGDVEGASLTVSSGVAITASSGDVTVANATSDKDLIFTVNDGGAATEVFRLDGDVSAILVASGKELRFADSGEKISGDGTDLTIASGGTINLTATTDVVVPANVGITFGTGEKIEGDNTNLTVTSGGAINLTATTDVVVPANVGITFGTGEKIEGDNTDLTITSGAKINLTATSDIHIPNDVGIVFGGASEKIEGDGTDLVISANNLTVDAAADIILDAGGNDFQFKAGGTHILSVVNSSSDVIIKPIVDAKDIIFQQRDGTEVARIEDNATFNVVTGKLAINGTAITSTAAELNLVDGITAGTVSASKAVITDSNKDALGFRNISATGTAEIGGDLQVGGNFTVSGTTTSVNTTNLEIADALLELNKNNSGGADTDAGLLIQRGSAGNNAAFYWNEGADKFKAVLTTSAATASAVTDSSTATIVANLEGAVTGNADTATALATARNIGGVSFDGSANINLPGVNSAGNQDTSGTAAIATTVTVSDNESTNESNVILFAAGAAGSGNLGVEADGNMTYNPSTGKITATGFVGAVTGDVTGDVTGNADTATALATARTIHGVSFDGTANIDLTEVVQDTVGAMVSSNTESGITVAYQDGDGTLDFTVGTLNQDTTGSAATLTTARTIGGVSFDGSANINLPGVNTAGNQNTSGTAAIATTVTVSDNESTNESNVILFAAGAAGSGNLGVEADGNMTYNPSTGKITATGFVGDVTGNADTATALETARTLGGVSFDGSANINLPGVNTAGNQNTSGSAATLTTARTIGGVSFDGSANINLPGVNTAGNQDTSGNADTATALATARTIAGQSFDGTGNISIAPTDLTSVTAVAGEINALDLGVTAVGNAIANKAVILDSNKDYTGLRNVTLSGELDAGSLDVSGNADIDGTLEADAITVNGTALADVIAGTTVNLATLASTVTITDNESTNENNPLIFAAGGDLDGGNLGLESDGTCTYNPSTGKITATGFVGTLTGTASAAQYSDLAERYHADAVMEKGDIVEIGGTNEITKTTQEISPDVFGVISHEDQAAFKMNDGHPDDTHPLVALTGRADVKVIGPISKGDRLVTSSVPGVARKALMSECTAFTVIGRALQDKTTEDVGIVLCYVNAKS